MFGLWLGGWLTDRWSRRDERAYLWVPALSLIASLPFMVLFLLWPEDHRIELVAGWPLFPVAFMWSVASSVLGAMHSAPFLSLVQGLAKLRMRASAAALFSLTGTGIGSAFGPLVVAYMSAAMEQRYGDDAVRWSLVWLSIGFLLAAGACFLSARGVRADLARTRAESAVSKEG